MKNKQSLNRILLVTLVSLFLASGTVNIFLSNNSTELQNQLELRDSTINKINVADSILCAESMRNTEIIEKYIDNCNFILKGKTITAEELILYTQQINDSLNLYRAFHNLTKKNLNIDYNISKCEDGRVISMEIPQDTLGIYKILYETAVKKYGIDYETKSENGDLVILNNFSKVDSAMLIFDYYKDKLTKDENGNWMIIVEKKVKE